MADENTVKIPVDEKVDTQEHIDAMVKKSENANTLDIDTGEENTPTETKVEEKKVETPKEKILGKFNTQDELVKSYQELEKKLGTPEESKKPDNLKAETKVEGLKGVDFAGVQAEFEENGELSEDTFKKLEDSGLPKSYVDNYIEGIKAVALKFEDEAYESAGGKDNYDKMITWVKDTLSPDEVKMFNDGIAKDNHTALYTIKGMFGRYASNTKEPNLAVGENAMASTGVRYESMAQVKADMSDPKYEKDPAFRKQVEEKLSRSTII